MKKTLFIFLLIMCQSNLADSQNLKCIGSAYWSDIEDVHLEGNKAFCALKNGLMLLDLTSPDTVFEIGKVFLPVSGSGSRRVTVNGQYAYISDCANGIQVVDISDTANPVVIETCLLANRIIEIAMRENIGFILIQNGFQIVDFSDPFSPNPISFLSLPGYGIDLDISGNLASVAGGDSNCFWVIDISNEEYPQLVGNGVNSNNVVGIAIKDQYAHIIDGQSAYKIYSLSNPENPEYISSVNVGECDRIKISGSYSYLLNEDGIAKVVDIGNVSSPSLIRQFDVFEFSRNLSIFESKLAVSTEFDHGNSYLTIFDLADPSNPLFLEYFNASHSSTRLHVSGDLAFICDYYHGLNVADVADRSQPHQIFSYQSAIAEDIFTLGNYAYLESSELKIFNITNPSQWNLLSSTYWGHSDNFKVQDSLVFISGKIINVVNPFAPAQLSSIAGEMNDVALKDNIAFIAAGSSGLNIVDFANPANPQLLNSLPCPGYTTAIGLYGNYCFLAYYISPPDSAGICAVDITNPSQPSIVYNSLDHRYMNSIFVYDNLLFLPEGNDGLYVMNINDPINPFVITNFNTGGNVKDAVFDGHYAYIGTSTATLILEFENNGIYDTSEQNLPKSPDISNFPNPYNNSTEIIYEIPKSSHVRLYLFNELGQIVGEYDLGNRQVGQNHFLMDTSGLPSGVYFYRIKAGEYSAVRKCLLLK